MKPITKIHQRACNEQEFVALIAKYESITIEDIYAIWTSIYDLNSESGFKYSFKGSITMSRLTGFGFMDTCSLCRKCNIEFVANDKHICNICVYGVIGIRNLQCQCNNTDLDTNKSYEAIEKAKTPEELMEAIHVRAEVMRHIYNLYLTLKGKMKKTIFVVYGSIATATKSGTYKSAKEAIADKNVKRYSFNTESDVKVGDEVKSSAYSTNLIVVGVLDKSFKYYNAGTGDLTNELTSTRCYAIKDLKIIEGGTDEEVVGSIVKGI